QGENKPLASLGTAVEQLMRDQLQAMSQLMQQQLEVLRRAPEAASGSASTPAAIVPQGEAPKLQAEAGKARDEFKPFGPYKPVQKTATEGFTPRQEAFVNAL